jgi:hypothetical protein
MPKPKLVPVFALVTDTGVTIQHNLLAFDLVRIIEIGKLKPGDKFVVTDTRLDKVS